MYDVLAICNGSSCTERLAKHLIVNRRGLKGDPIKQPESISKQATYKEPVANTPVVINFFLNGI